MANTTFTDGITPVEANWLNEINDHVYNDTPITPSTTVHGAGVISNTPAGTIAATTVQAAINELDSDVSGLTADLAAHLADTTDAHAASAITNTPAGNIAATTVQAAINELDTEKQPLDATLTALAGLATGADQLAYSTGSDTFSQTSFTSFARTILDDANAATVRTTTGTEPTLLAETTVSGAAVTSIQFTGLDLDTHKSYRIEFDWYNPTASISSLYLFMDNDTTTTNYWNANVSFDGATISSSRANNPGIAVAAAGKLLSWAMTLGNPNNRPVVLSHGNRDQGSNIILEHRVVQVTVDHTNVTQLDFTATIASSIGIGSTIRIYRGDK